MLILKATGAVCWLVAYREAAAETRKTGRQLLPDVALAFNAAWEVLYSAGGTVTWGKLSPEDRVQTVFNISWALSDIRWILALRRAGHSIPMAIWLLAAAYQVAFPLKLPPGEAARISALWQNLYFSAYCALTPPVSNSANARRFTVFRAVGTAVPTMTSGILRGLQLKYLLPGLGCLIFDTIRIVRMNRGRSRK